MRSKTIFAALLAGFLAGIALAKQPGPVIQNLGPVSPTPMPSPRHEEHIRLISSFTLNNKPTGETIVSFEATDFGVSGKGEDTRYRTIATEQYSLVDTKKPELRELRDQITKQVRDLESELLKFVDVAGPPRAREPMSPAGG